MQGKIMLDQEQVIGMLQQNEINSVNIYMQHGNIEQDYSGYNILHLAAQHGTPEAINTIVNLNPDLINQQSPSGYTPLELAIQANNVANYITILNNEHFTSYSSILKSLQNVAKYDDPEALHDIFQSIQAKNVDGVLQSLLQEEAHVISLALEKAGANNNLMLIRQIANTIAEAFMTAEEETRGFTIDNLLRGLLQTVEQSNSSSDIEKSKEVVNIIKDTVPGGELAALGNRAVYVTLEYLAFYPEQKEEVLNFCADVIKDLKTDSGFHLDETCASFKEQFCRDAWGEFCLKNMEIETSEFEAEQVEAAPEAEVEAAAEAEEPNQDEVTKKLVKELGEKLIYDTPDHTPLEHERSVSLPGEEEVVVVGEEVGEASGEPASSLSGESTPTTPDAE